MLNYRGIFPAIDSVEGGKVGGRDITYPKVEYVSSMKQEVMDDWVGFVKDRVLPIATLCPNCNGVIKSESPDHLTMMVELDGWHSKFGLSDADMMEVAKTILESTGMKKAIRETFDDTVHEFRDRVSRQNSYYYSLYEAETFSRSGSGETVLVRDTPTIDQIIDGLESFTYAKLAGRLTERDNKYTLATYCRHCQCYVPVEIPGSIPKDVAEIVVERYKKHRYLDSYRYRQGATESKDFKDRMEKFRPQKVDPAPVPISVPTGERSRAIRSAASWVSRNSVDILFAGSVITLAVFLVVSLLLAMLG